MFVSDAVNGYLYLFAPETTSLSEYLNTLSKLRKYDFRYMIQGHSPKLVLKKELDDYIDIARNPDWDKGKVKPADLISGPDAEVRVVMSKKRPRLSVRMAIEKRKLEMR